MTEDEAKTKWCPMARVSSDSDSAWNRVGRFSLDGSHPLCIGSACMMWRWAVETQYFPKENPDGSVEMNWIRDHSKTYGYCGLAGKPAGFEGNR